MTAGRWQEVERIYHSALDHAPDQRSAFLIEACAGDDELRSEVESLLAARTGKDSLIDDGGVAVAARLVAEPSQHLTGRKLGRYEVIRKLGSGGMGEVYLARDTRLGREVALKVLRPGSIDHTDRNRLEREAKAASALRHPNIVTVHDFDSCDGVDFIVMEYVPGRILSELIGRKGLPVREALGYAAQIADALIAAHAAGIIHRDLKPANLIVGDSGTLKVLDFGLAKRAPGLTSDETQSVSGGFVAGTAAYMSPEQAEGKPLDARTDIFSFGAVLYEFLVGTRAFERDSTASTIAAIMAEEPPSVKNVPPELDRIVQRCLRKDSARRFQTMADVKSALEDTRRELAPAAGTRKKRWISLTAAVIALAGAGILSWTYIPWQQRPEPQLLHLTSYPGSEYDPAFSPDGNQIAFVWDGEDQATSHIYVKLVGATDALRLTRDNRPERYPAWSRDGRWIAFNRRLEDGRAKIVITSALGGAERNIGELQACCSRLSWSADSKWLVAGEQLESNAGRLLLDVETREKRILLSPPAGAFGDYDPAFSPSGRAIAFVRNSGSNMNSGIFVVRLSESMKPSASPSRVTTDGGGKGEPAWTPDGREIVYVSGLPGYLAGEERRLWRVGSNGQSKPRQIAFTQDGSSQPSTAMNGHRLAYSLVTKDANIWRIPIRSSPAAPAKVAASTRDEYSPSYSPDGSKLVFSSNADGGYGDLDM